MKLPDLPFKLPEIPKHVALSLAVIAGSAILFGILMFTLAAARDQAVAANTNLDAEFTKTKRNLEQSKTDYLFIQQNQETYETLLKGERLVPHTRATAVRRLQELARQEGLTTLNYEFSGGGETSAASASSQPAAGDYRVNVETIKLTIGGPVDGKIYRFFADLAEEFPGAAVIQLFELSRAPRVDADALNAVSAGRDSRLVSGDVTFLWRTAQATDKKAEANKK